MYYEIFLVIVFSEIKKIIFVLTVRLWSDNCFFARKLMELIYCPLNCIIVIRQHPSEKPALLDHPRDNYVIDVASRARRNRSWSV